MVIFGNTYWNEQRFCGMMHRLCEGPREHDEASENRSCEKDKKEQIQYENDCADGHQATKCVGCNRK